MKHTILKPGSSVLLGGVLFFSFPKALAGAFQGRLKKSRAGQTAAYCCALVPLSRDLVAENLK